MCYQVELPDVAQVWLCLSSLIRVDSESWKGGVVMQDRFLFSDTIARNVAVGVERIDADRLNHAVRTACQPPPRSSPMIAIYWRNCFINYVKWRVASKME
jgi:hypothetical protein